MPVIESMARRHALSPADVGDLVGAGEERLLEACRKFDPEYGTPLKWFARFYAVNRVRDQARRLYRHHPGFAPKIRESNPTLTRCLLRDFQAHRSLMRPCGLPKSRLTMKA